MVSRERLPEQHADRPDIGRRPGLLPVQPLGRDVRERPRNVADGSQRVRVLHLGESEVEEPHRNVLLLGDEHVRGLHVAVHDPARMREGEPFEDLSGGLDRAFVVQLAGPKRLAKRRARHVLVRDVQVLVVGLESVCAQAMRVPEPRRRRRLAFRTRRRASLLGDDLQRDVDP